MSKRPFDQAAPGPVRPASQPGPRPDRRALLAAAVTVALWASAFVAIRSAGQNFSPGALALGRLLPAAAVLALISLIRRAGWPPRPAWPGIAATGVLWFGVYMVALNWGEQHVDAGTAAMVVNIGPILIALASGWLLREGLPRPLIAGITVSFAGVILVAIATSAGRHPSLAGVLLCLLAAVSYALAVVSQKPALRHASALQVTTFGCAVGALACLPFTGQLVSQLAAAPLTATLSVAYLGALPTAAAFTTWAYALARTSASKMGATTYLVPALTALMAWAILGQVPSLLALGGGMLCLAGVALSRRRPGTPKPAAPWLSYAAPPGHARRGLRWPWPQNPAGLWPAPTARRRLPRPGRNPQARNGRGRTRRWSRQPQVTQTVHRSHTEPEHMSAAALGSPVICGRTD